ncbi:signal peptidase I [Enterococcus sp. AZ163]|uniref:signal peptidase I n=1 Tax=Enterococcus sp. AZ163 TaxID=2774638 RepID=UPI003D28BF98
MKTIVNGLKNLMIVFLLLILTFNLYSLYQSKSNDSRFPMILGYGYAVVASGSMEPTLSQGDLVIVHEEIDYEKDDIITFIQEGDNRTTTHRVIEREAKHFITQGDANNAEDQPIVDEQIFGKVVATLPLIGYIIQFVRTPAGLLISISLFFLLFYLDTRRK